jgi:hypothetical protein
MNRVKKNTAEETRHFYMVDDTINLLKKSENFFKLYLEEENVNLLCEFSTNGCWKNCSRCKKYFKG